MIWKLIFDATVKYLVVALEAFLLEQLLEFLIWFARNFVFDSGETAHASA